MKNLILLTMIIALGCGQKKDSDDNDAKTALNLKVASNNVHTDTVTAVDCSRFITLNAMTDPTQQYNQLQLPQNADLNDPKFDQCRLDSHEISETDYNAAVSHASIKSSKTYKLSAILGLTTDSYKNYIMIEPDGANNFKFTVIQGFKYNPTCFAAPLFYTLKRLSPATDQDITFENAKIGAENVILFYLGAKNKHMNYTHHPLL